MVGFHSAWRCYAECWERKDVNDFTQNWTLNLGTLSKQTIITHWCNCGKIILGGHQLFLCFDLWPAAQKECIPYSKHCQISWLEKYKALGVNVVLLLF